MRIEVVTSLITSITAIASIIIAVLTLNSNSKQLNESRRQAQADFLYRIYERIMDWFRDNPEAEEWIYFGKEEISLSKKLKNGHTVYDKWDIDSLLSYFEMVWSFRKKRLIDDDMIYDMFSDIIIYIYQSHDFELKKIIEEMRIDEKAPDMYIGFETLYYVMQNFNSAVKKDRNYSQHKRSNI